MATLSNCIIILHSIGSSEKRIYQDRNIRLQWSEIYLGFFPFFNFSTSPTGSVIPGELNVKKQPAQTQWAVTSCHLFVTLRAVTFGNFFFSVKIVTYVNGFANKKNKWIT